MFRSVSASALDSGGRLLGMSSPSALETDVAPDDVGEQDDFFTAFDALSEGRVTPRRVPFITPSRSSNGKRG